jgi:hypothetical protein
VTVCADKLAFGDLRENGRPVVLAEQ